MVSLVRSTFFIPQSAMLLFFSMSIPAVSHFLNTIFTEIISYLKKVLFSKKVFHAWYFYTMDIFFGFGKYKQNF